MTQFDQIKKQVLEASLACGLTVIEVIPYAPGVKLPEELYPQPRMLLNLSKRYRGPIVIDESGIDAWLTFSGERFNVIVPWTAVEKIFDTTNQRAHDFSEENGMNLVEMAMPANAENQVAQMSSTRPKLETIEGGCEFTLRRYGHLTLVAV